jgi:hypothetical protein
MAPLVARADAFIPTMISANVLWVLALPLVVAIEGWLMVQWKWQRPYKNALKGNLWSMLAALPVGVGLSMVGAYLGGRDAQTTFAFLPESARRLLAQTFLYGRLPAPSYGFIDGFGKAGIFLAALLFVGICWLLTFAVEGHYYGTKNPSLTRRHVYGRTAFANLLSYGALLLLWIPYSYHSASSGQDFERQFCAQSNSWSIRCTDIWARFPEVKEARLRECRDRGLQEQICLSGSN